MNSLVRRRRSDGIRWRVPLISALCVGALAAGASRSLAHDVVDGFVPRSHPGANGSVMPYRLFIPDERARSRPLPMIIYLHGGAGRGTDNLRQISGGNRGGTHVWTTPGMQARHPAFVVAPQAPEGARWSAPDSDSLALYAELVIELLAALSSEFAIDADRVYVMGQSLGGQGTWDLATKRSRLFAAAVPLCGNGNPSRAAAECRIPVWAFHGAQDSAVPVSGSREMVAALRAAGTPVEYTEYAGAAHDVWTLAFAEPDLPAWLFAQRRRSR